MVGLKPGTGLVPGKANVQPESGVWARACRLLVAGSGARGEVGGITPSLLILLSCA